MGGRERFSIQKSSCDLSLAGDGISKRTLLPIQGWWEMLGFEGGRERVRRAQPSLLLCHLMRGF